MLTGISGNDIIVGAYATGDGICPMLAAHRNGGRTDFISFARAWDHFAFRDGRRSRSRRATERELRVLRVHLEASLLEDDAPVTALAAARAEHDGLVRERERSEARAGDAAEAQRTADRRRPGDADRAPELGSRPGWSWTRVVRRYDDYERLLERLEAESELTGPNGASAPRRGPRAPART